MLNGEKPFKFKGFSVETTIKTTGKKPFATQRDGQNRIGCGGTQLMEHCTGLNGKGRNNRFENVKRHFEWMDAMERKEFMCENN